MMLSGLHVHCARDVRFVVQRFVVCLSWITFLMLDLKNFFPQKNDVVSLIVHGSLPLERLI